ncbi:MAG: metal ABC transporter ATP-binding protein [Pseudomonadota bacterium]
MFRSRENPFAKPVLVASEGEPIASDPAIDEAPLTVRGLTVSYGGSPVIFSIDMTAHQGTMTAIVGPNGAGKSTLLKGVLGLVPALSGKAAVFGAPIAAARHRIAYVPQRAGIDWDFPVRVADVVAMGLYRELGLLGRLSGQRRAKVVKALERVGMGAFAHRQIGQLSGGQQQRVFLARALAQDADLILLDEPFAGVDAATEKAVVNVLRALRDAGKTVVAVHHDLTTVAQYFDRVFVINTRKIAEGSVAEAFTADALHSAYGGRLASAQLSELRAPAA